MEEIVNIVKEIKELEMFNKEEIDNNKTNTEKTPLEYLKEKKKELLQELNETKDVYKRTNLIAEIDKIKAQIEVELEKTEKIKDLYKKLDKEKLNINKNVEENKKIIQENKKDMYRIKDNRDKLRDAHGLIKPEYQNIYVEMTKQIIAKREENEKINNEIKELDELSKNIENRNLDKILGEEKEIPVSANKLDKSNENREQIAKEEELAWNAKEKEEAKQEAKIEANAKQEIEDDWKQTKKDKDETKGETKVIVDLEEPEIVTTNNLQAGNKLTIYSDRVEIENSTSRASIELRNVSKTEEDTIRSFAKETITKLKNNKTIVDASIVKGLLCNEKQLNDYLDLCEMHKYKHSNVPEIKSALEEYEKNMPEDFPEIEYNFKGLRKDKKLQLEDKLEMYKKSKETRKMFKDMNFQDKVNIKMSLLDKAYFETRILTENIKNKMALAPAKRYKEDIYGDNEDEYIFWDFEEINLAEEANEQQEDKGFKKRLKSNVNEAKAIEKAFRKAMKGIKNGREDK